MREKEFNWDILLRADINNSEILCNSMSSQPLRNIYALPPGSTLTYDLIDGVTFSAGCPPVHTLTHTHSRTHLFVRTRTHTATYTIIVIFVITIIYIYIQSELNMPGIFVLIFTAQLQMSHDIWVYKLIHLDTQW